jgi:hypothetical protein
MPAISSGLGAGAGGGSSDGGDVVKANPLDRAGEQQQEGPPPSYEVFARGPLPFCCLSGNSVSTVVTPEEVLIRHSKTICELPVSMGAGYEVTHFAMRQVSRYGMRSAKALCASARGSLFVAARPTGHSESAAANGADAEDFLKRMWRFLPPAMGRPASKLGAPRYGEATVVHSCGKITRTLAFHENGLATLDTVDEGTCNSMRDATVASLDNVEYITHAKAPCLQTCLCGRENAIQVVFRDGFDLRSHTAQQQELHAGVKAAILGRAPSAAIHVMRGSGSSIEIGPELTTIFAETHAWGGDCLRAETVTTVKTADISHLRATLPGVLSALVVAIRDIEIAVIWSNCFKLVCFDAPQAFTDPLSLAMRAWILIALVIKAVGSVIGFVFALCCRKSSVVLGGPGPAKEVVLPVEHHPEQLLRSIAHAVAAANELALQQRAQFLGDGISGAGKFAAGEQFVGQPQVQQVQQTQQIQRMQRMQQVQQMQMQPAQMEVHVQQMQPVYQQDVSAAVTGAQ